MDSSPPAARRGRNRRGRDRLTVRPFAFTTWGDWRREHPHTDVLLPPPHSERVRQSPDD